MKSDDVDRILEGIEVGGRNLKDIFKEKEEAPTIVTKDQIIHLLCGQLLDKCPPNRECIVSGYEGTCEECWISWAKDTLTPLK